MDKKQRLQKRKVNKMAEIIIYTTSWCPYCKRAKALLKELKQNYKEIDIEEDPSIKAEMMKKSGRKTVPQIFIDGEHIGGCDDLYELHGAGGLKPKLGL